MAERLCLADKFFNMKMCYILLFFAKCVHVCLCLCVLRFILSIDIAFFLIASFVTCVKKFLPGYAA